MSDDINAIFDLATPATTETAQNTTATDSTDSTDSAENTPSTDEAATSAAQGGALYPNVLRTLTQSEAGEGNPEGTLSISEFAGHLTVEAIRSGKGLEGIVKDAAIYTGTKAARHPLPVVLVFADDADQSDQKNAKVYIPVAEGTVAFANRPARGESASAATSKRSADELLEDAAKKALSLAAIETRFQRVSAQRDKATAQLEKYHGWLSQYYKADPATLNENETQEDANKRLLNEAIAAKAAELEEAEAAKAEAEKSDIPDTK